MTTNEARELLAANDLRGALEMVCDLLDAVELDLATLQGAEVDAPGADDAAA